MSNSSDNSKAGTSGGSAGLVEGIGQELKAYGQQDPPVEGQWTLRFDYSDTSTLTVFVTVSFGAPFPVTAELYSEMTTAQVGNLKDWLCGIAAQMKKASSSSGSGGTPDSGGAM